VLVRVATDDDRVEVAVVDDGAGGADEEGRGLRGLADRVESLGGTLALESPTDGGTRLHAEIPLGPARPLAAATRPRRASA
jgi:signal transduction histidine kinase